MRWLPCLLACAAAQAAEFAGSDLLDGALARGLVAAGSSADFAGTLPARRAFAEGRAEAVALLLRAGDAAPAAKASAAVEEFRLGAAVVVAAAHPSVRPDQLTIEQLANAFAKDARAPARNWNDLDPDARSELMTPAVCSPPGSLTLEIFQGVVLAGQPFRADVRLRVEPDLAADLLASRAGTILLLPRPPTGRGKVLQVADGRPGRSATAYGPDENNVHAGDYPLQLPLMLYVRKDRLEHLRPALRWLFSDEAAALLEKQGLYPAPKAARSRFLQRLDTR